jgi:heterodisulfide reductase subunit A-like polyferredoxin
MKRRDLLKSASLSIGAVSVNSLPDWLRAASEQTNNEVDVLVVGGGTAGTIAALQAAKVGARTMIVEMAGQLGGTPQRQESTIPACFTPGESRSLQDLAGTWSSKRLN